MARLFEQPTVTTPDTTERVASGKTGTPTSNITWANFVTWLQDTALAFLRPSNNLSDLDNVVTARTNLEVKSEADTDSALALKADEADVLTKTNTTSYTPSQAYHPATFDFVNKGGSTAGWFSATRVSSAVDAASFNVKCIELGGWIHINGQVLLNSNPGADVLFSLPGSFGSPSVDIFFNSSDASASENNEWFVEVGTKNIKADNYSTGSKNSFSVTYPTI